MNWTEVLSNLCYYDKRNPYGYFSDTQEEDESEEDVKPKNCMCDNCFYRRNELALEIIKLMINNTI